MAIARVQHAATSAMATFPTSVTISASGSGNLILVFLEEDAVNTGITDNAGNTYINAPNANALSPQGFWTSAWYAKNSIAGATTITPNTAVRAILVVEYSGVDTSNPIDDAQHLDSTTSGTGVSLTNTNSGSVLVTLFAGTGTAVSSITVNAPWTLLDSLAPTSIFVIGLADAEYFPGSVGTFHATFNLSGSGAGESSSGIALIPSGAIVTNKSSMFLVF